MSERKAVYWDRSGFNNALNLLLEYADEAIQGLPEFLEHSRSSMDRYGSGEAGEDPDPALAGMMRDRVRDTADSMRALAAALRDASNRVNGKYIEADGAAARLASMAKSERPVATKTAPGAHGHYR